MTIYSFRSRAFVLLLITSSCSSCVISSDQGRAIHTGDRLEVNDAEKISAKLVEFRPQAGRWHFNNELIVFDVSEFLVVAPRQYAGQEFEINHFDSRADSQEWTDVGKTYEMLVPDDLLNLPQDRQIDFSPRDITIIGETEQ